MVIGWAFILPKTCRPSHNWKIGVDHKNAEENKKENSLVLNSSREEIGLTLDERGEIGKREELVEGSQPRASATHLSLQIIRRILGWRRGWARLWWPLAVMLRRGLPVSRGVGASEALLPILFSSWGGITRRQRRRRRAKAGGRGDKVQKAPHVLNGKLLVVILCPFY